MSFIVNLFATFVIKIICLESLTQSIISILQNPPMLMLQIMSTIWTNKYNTWKNNWCLQIGPLSTWQNILGLIKEHFDTTKKFHIAWEYSKNIHWCGIGYAPKKIITLSPLTCSLFVIHLLVLLRSTLMTFNLKSNHPKLMHYPH